MKKSLLIPWLVYIFALALMKPSGVRATDAVLTDDTFTSTSNPSLAAGTSSIIRVRTGAKSYLKFSLGSLPSGIHGADIQKATLRLYANAVVASGSMNVLTPSSKWNENTLVLRSAPTDGSVEVFGIPITAATVQHEVLVDLTALTADWVDGVEPNQGVVLEVAAHSSLQVDFDSKENTVTSRAPRLEITLANTGATGAQGPKGDPGPTGPQGLQGPAGANGLAVRSGTGAPAASLGVDGDFYVDTSTSTFYGPRVSGTWGSPLGSGSAQSAAGPYLLTSSTVFNPAADSSSLVDYTATQLPHSSGMTRLRVMRFGDSLQEYGPGPVTESTLQTQIGPNGTISGVSPGTDPIGGAVMLTLTASDQWISGLTILATAGQGALWWNNANQPAYQTMDEAHVYFLGEPGAGTFQIKSSADASAWQNEPAAAGLSGTVSYSFDGGSSWNTSSDGVIPASTPTLTCGVVRILYPSAHSRVFEGIVTSGTVRFPRTLPIYSVQGSGYIIASNVIRGGRSLAEMFTTSTNIWIPFLKDAKPDVVLFEMVHDGWEQPAYMTQLKNIFTAAGLATDFSICGIHAGSGGLDHGRFITTYECRELQRQWAIANGAHFFDSYAISGGSERAMADRGWLSSGDVAITGAVYSSGTISYALNSSTRGSGSLAGIVITGCAPDGFNIVNDQLNGTLTNSGSTLMVASTADPGPFTTGGKLHLDEIHPSGSFALLSGKLWAKSLTDVLYGGEPPVFSANVVTTGALSTSQITIPHSGQGIVFAGAGSDTFSILSDPSGGLQFNANAAHNGAGLDSNGFLRSVAFIGSNGTVDLSADSSRSVRLEINSGGIFGYSAYGGERLMELPTSGGYSSGPAKFPTNVTTPALILSGSPSTPTDGAMMYDSATGHFKGYSGGTWHQLDN